MLSKIYQSYRGAEYCLLCATDAVFWPSMAKDIEVVCQACPTCAQYGVQAALEPMLSHPTPTQPWQFVSQDIFELGLRQYLITVDRYSDFYKLDPLTNNQTPPSWILPKPISPAMAYRCAVSRTVVPSLSRMSIKHFKRMVLNKSLHRPTGLTATVKPKQLSKMPSLPIRRPTTSTSWALLRPSSKVNGQTYPIYSPSPPSYSNRSLQILGQSAPRSQYNKHARPSLLPLPLGSHVYAKPRPPQLGTPWIYAQVVDNPSPSSYSSGRLIRMPKKFEDYSLY